MICRSQWLLLSGKAKKIQPTLEDLLTGGHDHFSLKIDNRHHTLERREEMRNDVSYFLAYIAI